MRSKFQAGGGEVVYHSSVSASHGSLAARAPAREVLMMFQRNTSRLIVITPEPIVEQPAEELRPPVVEPGEDGEDAAAEHDVVHVRDDVVGVRHLPVDGEGREEDSGEPAD